MVSDAGPGGDDGSATAVGAGTGIPVVTGAKGGESRVQGEGRVKDEGRAGTRDDVGVGEVRLSSDTSGGAERLRVWCVSAGRGR